MERLYVNTGVLRDAFVRALDHLEEVHGKNIPLDHDFFWSIDAAERYDPYNPPTQFTMGQLTDSLTNLERMISDEQPLGYALVWLADVLEAVGKEIID